MVLDNLGDSLRSQIQKLRNKQRLSEEDVDAVVKEIQRSLLQADVDTSIVTELSENIKKNSLETDPAPGVTVKDHVLQVVYEELVSVVGESTEIPLDEQTILLAGLQGSGKTTTAVKIAWWFSKKGLQPAVIQTDTFRPGAYQQSKQLCETAEVEFYGNPDAETAAQVAEEAIEETPEADVRIFDTEGRHAMEEELIEEIEKLEEIVQPDRSLLVMDAATGKGAKDQAKEFDRAIGIDSVVLTKMDGTAKGGGALTAVNETGASLSFIGTGETHKDIERFEPSGFVSRLLGMGDLKQLSERVERAQQTIEESDEDWSPEDALEGDFTLVDMRKQMRTMNEMGPLEEVMNMIPGMGNNMMDKLDDVNLKVEEEKMKEYDIIMDSMTEKELKNPGKIKKSRVERIARGSGTSKEEVRDLLQRYNKMKKVFNKFGSKKDIEKMANQLSRGGNFPQM